MPKLVNSLPKYRLHKVSGQAMVTLTGRDIYLGPFGTKASKTEYDRLVGEWLAAGRPDFPSSQSEITVVELAAAYKKFARTYYRKNGCPTGTADTIDLTLKLLCKHYGRTSAADFGPLALESLQQRMIALGQSRRYINDNINRIRRMFRWGVAKQLIPPAVIQGLAALPRLQKDRTDAREAEPVRPVDNSTVESTLPHLPPIVADMIRVQRLSGCRPGEICIIRPCDIDTSGDVWLFRPQSHKTEHFDRERVICFGPQAQQILQVYLVRDPLSYCFVPAEGETRRNAAKRASRQSPMTPSQAKRRPKSRRRRPPGNRYTADSYRRAIHRAVDCVNELRREEKLSLISRWSPNRLRHSAATEIRQRFGLEAVQVALGHASAKTSEIYAERDLSLAIKVMREVG